MNDKKELVSLEEQSQQLKHSHFVEQEHACPLCNSELQVKVKDYLGNYQIAEEASCATCDLVIRKKNHHFH